MVDDELRTIEGRKMKGLSRFSFVLLCFVSGNLTFASFPVIAQDTDDIRDISGPVAYSDYLFLFFLGAVLVCGIITWFLFQKITGNKEQVIIDLPKPAWEIALAELESLKGKNLPDKGEIKLFYIELSLILRRYIENRFLIKAPEMTTEEFLEFLKESKALNQSQKSRLQDFLISCDMVKFARQKSEKEEMQKSFNLVVKFVEETTITAEHSEEGAKG